MPAHPPPVRRANALLRSREYLIPEEMDLIIHAAKKRTMGLRDALLMEIIYRHALRPTEALKLRWEDIDIVRGYLYIKRYKTNEMSMHTIEDDEMRALRWWKAQQRRRKYGGESIYVFPTNRGLPMTVRGFSKIMKESAIAAGITQFTVHPYMLRHSKGYELVNAGHGIAKIAHWFAHKKLETTKRYTTVDVESTRGFSKRDTSRL